MATVTKIPQTLNTATRLPLSGQVKRKVAAYARVSTDSDEQFTSFEAQVDYYENYIKARPDWEYVGIYTDEGISGTNIKKREGFNKMIDDALAGKIDLIVTKSVSRFARNTVDSLSTIRKLKAHNIACYFEKENINTLESNGELLITIVSSFAQEESRSISENVTWGQRKRFSDGKVSFAYKNFLGYKKGPDGKPMIVEEEAKVVRKIYSLFMQGYSFGKIANVLESEGIKSPGGANTWSPSTIRSILQNEKYKGDALLQKRFTVDFLQKKLKKNEGEVAQYYVEGNHEPIIIPSEWDIVQEELKRRKVVGPKYTNKAIFSSKLICCCCGGYYGQKTWHSTDKYKTVVWQCNDKFKNKEKCRTPNLKEEDIQQRFIKAYNQMLDNKKNVIQDCLLMKSVICDTKELEDKLQTQKKEVDFIKEHVDLLIQSNASRALNQDEYLDKYNDLKARYETEVNKYNGIEEEIISKKNKAKAIDNFIDNFKKHEEVLNEWDMFTWNIMVETAIVNLDKTITFKFYGGFEAIA